MKKVSTRAAAQSRNISQQKLTIGLDLGDRNSWYCVVDEAGQIQREQRVRTSGEALQEVFGALPRSRIALEIGTHSPWISRLLSELGHEVIVANARKVRLIGESRKKDDRLDAQTLARLARIDPELLYPVKHRSVQAQADLTLIRARAGLVRARTGLVNTARGLAKSYGERLRSCNVRNLTSIRSFNNNCASWRSVFCFRTRFVRISAASPIHNSNCKSFSRHSNQRACPLASIPIRTFRVLSVL